MERVARGSHRGRAVVTALLLVVVGTGCAEPASVPEPDPTTMSSMATDTTSATPTPSEAPSTPTAVTGPGPDEVEEVLNQLAVVLADAQGEVLALDPYPNGWPDFPEDVLGRVADVYADDLETIRFETLYVGSNEANRDYFLDEPGPATYAVTDLATSEPDCVVVRADLDVSAVTDQAAEVTASWFVLGPRTDDLGFNPTSWEIRFQAADVGSQPPEATC